MLGKGIDSALLAVELESSAPQVFATQPSMNPFRRLTRHAMRTYYGWSDRIQLKPNPPCGVFTSDRSFRGNELIGDLRSPDVIHMHWVAEMFDEASFLPAATALAPVIWTMRDMRPITGGCHYDLGCGRFREGCGQCPQLAHPSDNDISRRIWKRRRKTLSSIKPSRLTFASPSKWLAQEFNMSALTVQFPIHVIPNGVDTDVFFPADSNRKTFPGVNPDALVILFNAASLDNEIKGGKLLREMIVHLQQFDSASKHKLQLLAVGAGQFKQIGEIETVTTGHLQSNEQLVAAYQAADLFVIPSLQDNCPNTVLEAFACGVPVVGFNATGIADLIVAGETGLLATPFRPSDLAQQVSTILDNDQLREKMSANCRELAVTEYSREIETQRYLDLYQDILAAQS